jgi:hypothetical protein
MSEQIDFEELIDELIKAAQDVTAAFEQGTGTVGAERELDEARKKLFDFIMEVRAKRDMATFQIEKIADSLQCHPSMALDVINSWCVKLLNPNRVPSGIMRHVQEKLNSNQQIFRRGTVEPLYVYASGLQDRVDELEGKK